MNIFKHNGCIYNKKKYTTLFTSAKSAVSQTAFLTVSQRSGLNGSTENNN